MQTRYPIFRPIQLFLLVINILAMLCTASIVFSLDTSSVFRTSLLSEGWYYMEDGKQISVTLPGSVADDGSGSLTLYHDLPDNELSGKYLTTRSGIYQLRASLGDRALYQYAEQGFRRNRQMRSKIDCFFILPDNLENKTLALTYTSDGSGPYNLPQVTVVDSDSIFLYYFYNSLFSLGIVALMYLLGFTSIWYFYCLKRRNLSEKRFVNLGLFLLICGTWCLTDSSSAQLLGQMSSSVCYVSFFCFALFAIPMIYFIKSTGNMAKYRIIDWVISAFYLNNIIQIFLNRFFGIDLIDMLFVTHLLLVIGIGILAYLLIRQYHLEKNREILTLLVAFAMIAFGGLLALALYWLWDYPYYQEIFECGILVFIILLLRRIIITSAENAEAKMEMRVYMRLSREDGLTSLPNRRCFDEYIAKLESRTSYDENAILIFLDINNLKVTNDTYGHNAGDELIIAAARCLQSVFCENATCYRTGGDEFCVIISNPTETPEYWNRRLDEAIKQYNQTHAYPLALARGYSYLLDDQGNTKTISDWKYEADQEMYRDKLLADFKRNGRMEDWNDLGKTPVH